MRIKRPDFERFDFRIAQSVFSLKLLDARREGESHGTHGWRRRPCTGWSERMENEGGRPAALALVVEADRWRMRKVRPSVLALVSGADRGEEKSVRRTGMTFASPPFDLGGSPLSGSHRGGGATTDGMRGTLSSSRGASPAHPSLVSRPFSSFVPSRSRGTESHLQMSSHVGILISKHSNMLYREEVCTIGADRGRSGSNGADRGRMVLKIG